MLLHTHLMETLKFSFVLTSPTHALIFEYDGTPASGTMDLQQPAAGGSFTAAQISGKYSSLTDGIDHSGALKNMSIAGTFAADGMGAVTSGTLDINNGGTFTTTSFTGTLSPPDSNGRGNLIMNTPVISDSRTFVYYIISPKVLRILEGDNISFVGGSAYAQGSAGSTVAAVSGKFVYQHHGWSSPGRTVAAGQLSADGMGKVTTGVSDSNSGGLPTTVIKGTTVTGTYKNSRSSNGALKLTHPAGSPPIHPFFVCSSLLKLPPPQFTRGGGGAPPLYHP